MADSCIIPAMQEPFSPQSRSSGAAFGRLWLARDVAALGNWVLFIALLIYAYSFSESATNLSILVVAQILVPFIITPLLRPVINQRNGTPFAVTALLMRATVILPLVLEQQSEGIIPILQVAFFASIPLPFAQLSMSALFKAVVPASRAEVRRRSLLGASMLTTAAGPALGAIVYGMAGIQGAAIAAVVALLISAVILFFVRPMEVEPLPDSGLTDIAEPYSPPVGVAAAFGDPKLRVVAITQAVAALMTGGLVVAEAMYVINGLFVEIENIAPLLAAQGAGVVLGGIAHIWLGRRYTAAEVATAGLALVAGGELGFAISASLSAGAALTAAIGAGLCLTTLGLADLGQRLATERSSPDSRGQGLRTVVAAACVLSAIVVGPLCDTVNPRFALVTVGILVAVLALYAFGALPEVSAPMGEAEETDIHLRPLNPA